MDGLTMLAAGSAAGAVFVTALAAQNSFGTSRRTVQDRIVGSASGSATEERTRSLIVPRIAALSGRGRRVAFDLERAGLAFTVTEYLMIRAGVGVAGAVVAILLSKSFHLSSGLGIFVAILGFLVGYWLPAHYLSGRKAKRLRKIEDQLLDVLVSMAKSLKAGVGLTQALEYAGRDTPNPLGQELDRVVRELRLGADLEVVLEEMNGRVGSPDLEITSTAIIIQRRAGGNLSEILSNVANTIRERKMIRNELNALTAKQRLQGNASALIPIAVAAFFILANPDTGKLLFTTTAGLIALGIGIFFEVLGIWMVRHFSNIEV